MVKEQKEAKGNPVPSGEVMTFTYKEVVEALLRYKGLHEGIWELHFGFALSAVNMGNPKTGEFTPAAILPVAKIGIQRTDKETNLSADASSLQTSSKQEPLARRDEKRKSKDKK